MLSIRKLIEDVHSGEIRIPDFQRGFVWDPDRIAYLMDSIYKSYPFGTLILWKTREKLARERKLGPFSLPEPKADYPIHYVLDGQQRITSIFGVFQTYLEPDPKEPWPEVYFDFEASEDLQDTQFVSPDEVIPGRHFPISTFFDSSKYRQATSKLTDERAEIIDKVQSTFKEAVIPTQEIVTENRAKVAIVFERVNRLGVELDTLQLLSAWTWSDDFHLRDKFNSLAEKLEPFGFGSVGDDSNLLLRCCAAVATATSEAPLSFQKGPDASPAALMEMSGAEVRARFDLIANGVRGAIDFLRTNVNVEKLTNLPYPTVLAPLSVFFAHPDGKSAKMTESQRSTLLKWFWRSCFSRRFSAGVLRNLKRDIEEVDKLRNGEPSDLAYINASVGPDLFRDRIFSISAVDTKTYVLMLAQFSPRSFVSGAPVSLQAVLQNYNRSEFHHLMPQKFLKQQDYASREINSLANFAMISASDNKTLGGSAPSKYKEKMPSAETDAILESALCPNSLFDDDYTSFIEARSVKLAAAANSLIA